MLDYLSDTYLLFCYLTHTHVLHTPIQLFF